MRSTVLVSNLSLPGIPNRPLFTMGFDMRTINLFTLTRPSQQLNEIEFNSYLSICGETAARLRSTEILAIRHLVDNLHTRYSTAIKHFDGFAVSYSVPQISKEFDLLKIGSSAVLNIEIKSQLSSKEKIRKQLLQNRHYLEHLEKPILQFTCVSTPDTIFRLLEDGTLCESSWEELADAFQRQELSSPYPDDFDAVFHPSQFLVSPFNNTEAFLAHQYYLTDQQEEYKKQILGGVSSGIDHPLHYAITGRPGTGKTLLLYDIAREISKRAGGAVCIIHGGSLNDGQNTINEARQGIRIIDAKSFASQPPEQYKALLFDEAQRIYPGQLSQAMEWAKDNEVPCIFSFDTSQSLSETEKQFENEKMIDEFLSSSNCKLVLSNKIRTNKAVAGFIKAMLRLEKKSKEHLSYPVEILYARSYSEAREIISELEIKGYQYISLTNSRYTTSTLDYQQSNHSMNTHHVIGQEFDKVAVSLDHHFFYDESGNLQAKPHPHPDYLLIRLLFQAVTRARSSLAIVVVDNPPLFKNIYSILE